MHSTLSKKGHVTIPKLIRDVLGLQPGCKINFVINEASELILQKANSVSAISPNKRAIQSSHEDRFEQARGRADVQWRTQNLMRILRGEY
jgi:AbrB family looped-hinge helix DNA binding protein